MEEAQLVEKQRALKLDVKDNGETFVHRLKCLKTLRLVGLDVHGGLASLQKAFEQRTTSHPRHPMANLRVVDPEKARQYIKIGVHIGTNIPEHPSTLQEAADPFAEVSGLVQTTEMVPNLEEKIAASKDDVEKWTQKREVFRIKTKERYRQVLLDMAQEERLYEQVSRSLTELD